MAQTTSGHCLCGAVSYMISGDLRPIVYCHCKSCGSNLFWVPEHHRHWSVFAGALDRPTGLKAASHIFVHLASDYYDINDGLPIYENEFPPYFPDEQE